MKRDEGGAVLSDCGWSIELGRAAFREAFPDYDSNIFREDETWTREHYPPELADPLLEYEPSQSNDFLLEEGLQRLAARAPAPLVTQIHGVFAVRTRTQDLNAEAWCHANRGRLVAVHSGTRSALMAFALVQRKTTAFIQGLQADGTFESIGAVVSAAQTQMALLAQDPVVQGVFGLRQQWSQQGHLGLEESEIAWLSANDEQVDGGSAMSMLTELGEWFIIGHELAHHLLGHTWEKAGIWPHCSHDAISLLETWRAKLGLPAHVDIDSRTQELDADLLGFLLLSGVLKDGPDYPTWYGALFGALLAFPVMELLVGAAGEPTADMLGAYGEEDDYPPIGERVEQIATVARAFPGPPPSDGSHAPEGLVIQMLLFRDLLLRFGGR